MTNADNITRDPEIRLLTVFGGKADFRQTDSRAQSEPSKDGFFSFPPVCMCMYLCVRCMWVCTHVCKPEINVRSLAQLLPTLPFETGPLTGPGSVRLVGQRATEILLPSSPHLGDDRQTPQPALYVGAGHVNSDAQAFMVSMLPTEPSSPPPPDHSKKITPGVSKWILE